MESGFLRVLTNLLTNNIMRSPELTRVRPDLEASEKITVRDIKTEFETRFGVGTSGTWSDRQKLFWNNLNRLGARNINEIPPETTPDIDATVELSAEEAQELRQEMSVL